jgi:hypothetical protein
VAAENEISEDEVNAFASKLETWSNELPEKERQLLHMMLTVPGGSAGQAEVEGFDWNSYATMSQQPYRYQLQGNMYSVIGRFQFDNSAYHIKESGPSWVNSPRGWDRQIYGQQYG